MEQSLESFADRMGEIFPVLMREIFRYENNYLTRGQITPPQLWTLGRLVKAKSCQMHELAQWMNLRFSSATGLVDRMVKQKLVARRRDDEDRRVVWVDITPKGRRIFQQIWKQKREGIIKLYARLSAVERTRYMEILNKLVQSLTGQS